MDNNISESTTPMAASDKLSAAQPVERKPAGKKIKLLWIILAAAVLCAALSVFLVPWLAEQRRIVRYNRGAEYLSQNDYEQARAVFLALGEYADAPVLAVYADKGVTYTAAKEDMKLGNYEAAYSSFEDLKGFKDSDALAEECQNTMAYEKGRELFNAGSYAKAAEKFDQANGYKDAQSMAEESRQALAYEKGAELFHAGSYADAIEELTKADGYKDSLALLEECHLFVTAREIEDDMARKGYAHALELLDGEYGRMLENHDELVKECTQGVQYCEAEEDLANGLNYTARQKFLKLGSFLDASSRARECILPNPSTGETYHNPDYSASGCSLKINPNSDAEDSTYFKLYAVSGDKEILVSCVFINGGETATIRLPGGTYVLKLARSSGDWYGAKEMFGDAGTYQRLKSSETSDRFKLTKGGQFVLTMKAQNGNIITTPEPSDKF